MEAPATTAPEGSVMRPRMVPRNSCDQRRPGKSRSSAHRNLIRAPLVGIRLALGAEPRDVLWLVLRETLVLVLTGVVIGLPATLATTRLIPSMLFGVTP